MLLDKKIQTHYLQAFKILIFNIRVIITRILSGHIICFYLYQRIQTTSKHLSVMRKIMSHTRSCINIGGISNENAMMLFGI